MDNVVASYLVKVTLRDSTDYAEGQNAVAVPTNAEMEEIVQRALNEWDNDLTATASSERTDK